MSNGDGFPPRSDPRWDMVAAGRISGPWTNLAMKIMLARIVQEVASDKSDGNIRRCGDQIYDFFKKNEKVAAQDLHLIFG